MTVSERKLRVGLIGVGGIGQTHLARYKDVPDAQLVAICDAREEAAQMAAETVGARAFGNVEAMLGGIELDAVDICTPTAAHREPALSAIGQGKHVLCEKPLAESPTAAREIVDAARNAAVLLMTAFCHRFHPPILQVKQLIEEGKLGEVCQFRNRFAGLNPGMESKWFSRKSLAGGGALLDTSIHSVDLFRFLVGEVDRVQAVVTRVNPAISEVEDTGIALLSTADDRMGTVEASWSLVDGYNVVELYGTRGAALIHYWDGMPSRYKMLESDGWRPLSESGPDRFLSEIRHFVDACLGRTQLRVTGEDGLRAVEILHEAYRVGER